ncbi:hypothetical protein [Mycolicibacterium sp. P1-18]|nr:hypothetical protein [Mycolicibacterium sp. P1-18]
MALPVGRPTGAASPGSALLYLTFLPAAAVSQRAVADRIRRMRLV